MVRERDARAVQTSKKKVVSSPTSSPPAPPPQTHGVSSRSNSCYRRRFSGLGSRIITRGSGFGRCDSDCHRSPGYR
eukprot:NODE_13619_length_357_cov_2.551948_g12462_i0.p3 GENE.NODE_13619_length_357_cov_2.551948_g12462_i0~~NODE_13619_length_357_cov_2.551948_g12462_i0.p3  ORF type:complete len:76 (-),score=0.25 NODE_13619_length_357_cov_2.551948_g12462_i0:30-257(-)